MRATAQFVAVFTLLAFAPIVHAETTVLAREETIVREGDDIQAAIQELLDRAVERAREHPCLAKAEKEKRTLGVRIGFSTVIKKEVIKKDSVTIIAEVTSDECR